MRPSDDHEAKIQAEEQARLQRMVSQLTEADKQRIHEEGTVFV